MRPAARGWFDVSGEDVGLTFTHFNGMSGEFLFPEMLPPGVALFDYDNDGDLDVFLVQGDAGQASRSADASVPPAAGAPLNGRLFRNDLRVDADGTRDAALHRRDRQAASTRAATAWESPTGDSTTTAASTSTSPILARIRLFRNNCDGTFTDVSKDERDRPDSGWSVSAAFVDYRSRRVAGSVRRATTCNYESQRTSACFGMAGGRTIARRASTRAQPSRLYHNNGDGTFIDVTARRRHGRASSARRSASSTADFDGDGWIDIYVANDGKPNQLWINQRNGTFRNTALLAGAALDRGR